MAEVEKLFAEVVLGLILGFRHLFLLKELKNLENHLMEDQSDQHHQDFLLF